MSRFIVVNWSNKWNDKNSKTFPKTSKSDRECVRGRDRTLTVHILTYTKCKITLPLPFVSKSILWSSIKTGAISSNDHQFAFNKYLIKSINEIISFFGKIELIDHFFFFSIWERNRNFAERKRIYLIYFFSAFQIQNEVIYRGLILRGMCCCSTSTSTGWNFEPRWILFSR